MNVWDQVSVSLSVLQGHTELEPPDVLIKQKITEIQEAKQVLDHSLGFMTQKGSAWESAF